MDKKILIKKVWNWIADQDEYNTIIADGDIDIASEFIAEFVQNLIDNGVLAELSSVPQTNELLPLVSGSASFDAVKRIWNAAENYTLHELGEICKGDGAYCEDVPDLETYFERHYR